MSRTVVDEAYGIAAGTRRSMNLGQSSVVDTEKRPAAWEVRARREVVSLRKEAWGREKPKQF